MLHLFTASPISLVVTVNQFVSNVNHECIQEICMRLYKMEITIGNSKPNILHNIFSKMKDGAIVWVLL